MVLGKNFCGFKKRNHLFPGLDPSQLLKGALKYRKRFKKFR